MRRVIPSDELTEVTDAGCWNWTERLDRAGYARMGRRLAYRDLYEQEVGPIPAGLYLDHLCRNTKCVNPAHLEPVTPKENNRRKEQALGIGQYATHCIHGHAFTVENTYFTPNVGRQQRSCRTCQRATAARYLARKSAAK